MGTDQKRFTISVTPQMEADLNLAKQRFYCTETRNAMIQDLIVRGLDAQNAEESSGKRTEMDASEPHLAHV